MWLQLKVCKQFHIYAFNLCFTTQLAGNKTAKAIFALKPSKASLLRRALE